MSEKLSKEDQRELFKADKKTRETTKGEWPKYAMAYANPQGGGKKRLFLTFSGAAQLYDSGHVQVDFGRYVLNQDFSMRLMTDHDQHEISNAADEWNASK